MSLPPGDGGNDPPIFFSVAPKRKRAVHGPKEKALGRKTARCALFAYDAGVPARDPGRLNRRQRWARALVLAISISLAFGLRRKLAHSDARPLPTKTASLGFHGGPCLAEIFGLAPATTGFVRRRVQDRFDLRFPSAAALPTSQRFILIFYPGSAKRSGERGKRRVVHSTTTPKAAPTPPNAGKHPLCFERPRRTR